MSDSKSLTVTRHLPVKLTNQEKNEKNDSLVRTINDLERLEDNFTMLKDQHKANVKSRQVAIRELSHDLGNGFVMRPVACEQMVNLITNEMETRRSDTGELFEKRALTVDEMKHYASKNGKP